MNYKIEIGSKIIKFDIKRRKYDISNENCGLGEVIKINIDERVAHLKCYDDGYKDIIIRLDIKVVDNNYYIDNEYYEKCMERYEIISDEMFQYCNHILYLKEYSDMLFKENIKRNCYVKVVSDIIEIFKSRNI